MQPIPLVIRPELLHGLYIPSSFFTVPPGALTVLVQALRSCGVIDSVSFSAWLKCAPIAFHIHESIANAFFEALCGALTMFSANTLPTMAVLDNRQEPAVPLGSLLAAICVCDCVNRAIDDTARKTPAPARSPGSTMAQVLSAPVHGAADTLLFANHVRDAFHSRAGDLIRLLTLTDPSTLPEPTECVSQNAVQSLAAVIGPKTPSPTAFSLPAALGLPPGPAPWQVVLSALRAGLMAEEGGAVGQYPPEKLVFSAAERPSVTVSSLSRGAQLVAVDNQTVYVTDCADSTIFIVGMCRYAFLRNLTRTRVVFTAIQGLLIVDDCADTTIHACATGIRVWRAANLTLNVFVSTRPVVAAGAAAQLVALAAAHVAADAAAARDPTAVAAGIAGLPSTICCDFAGLHCNNVVVGPYNTCTGCLHNDLAAARLDVQFDRWHQPRLALAPGHNDPAPLPRHVGWTTPVCRLMTPEEFYIFVSPVRTVGDTVGIPQNLPPNYQKAMNSRHNELIDIRTHLHQSLSNLSLEEQAIYKTALQHHFRRWLEDNHLAPDVDNVGALRV